MLAFSEFARLAQQGNYVPVTLTLTADLETPRLHSFPAQG